MLSAPEPLGPEHDLDRFSSGVPILDDWLKRRALANQASGASRTFVVCDEGEVVGYYALAASAVSPEQTLGRFRRNMPNPVPVIVLGRLAVAVSHQGRGIGRGLFQDAARRVIATADAIGVRGMIVHAITEEAAEFHRRLGFDPSPLDPMTLMVTVAELRASVK